MDMSRYRELFLSETREHLNRMGPLLIALEREPAGREVLDALFREVHSVKGMAFSMGYAQTAALAHQLEEALEGFRRGGGVTTGAVDRLLSGFDLLESLLDDVQHDRPERDVAAFLTTPAAGGAPAACPRPAARPGSEGEASDPATPRVPVVTASALPVGAVFQVTVELAGEAAAPAARCLLILRELEKSGEVLNITPSRELLVQGGLYRQVQVWLRTVIPKPRLEKSLRAMTDVVKVSFVDDRRSGDGRRGDSERSVRVRVDLLDRVVSLASELLTRRAMLQRAATARDWDQLGSALDETACQIDDLHRQALQVRLAPFDSITGRLPRLIRDLAHKTGKQVDFRLAGGGVQLDRVILEELSDALGHLVCNAVDHGIEVGRPGEVTVAARRKEDLVLIEVRDNGRGMDPEPLRRQAVARGFLTPWQVDQLSDQEVLMLVCIPGFSTAGEVTETSGRGVGMDVVKAAVERLGGTIDIRSAPGTGTCVQLRLPLSTSIAKILQVRCGGHVLALPFARVQEELELPAAAVSASGPRRFFRLAGEEIELVALDRLLGLPSSPSTEPVHVALSELSGRRIGFQVDRFLGSREVFVRPLGFPLDRLPGMSGAVVRGDGSLLFIIDPHPLLDEQGVCPFRGKEVFDVLS